MPQIAEVLDAYQKDREEHGAGATVGYCVVQLKRILGDLPCDLLNKDQVRLYMQKRRAAGAGGASAKHRKKVRPLSDGTLSRELRTLRAGLRWAVKAGWIAGDPHVEVPKAPPPRDRWLTREEADRLLRHAGAPHIRLFIALALNTAARHGALVELKWAQVSLGANRVALGRGVGNKRRATVPINSALRPLLAEAWEELKASVRPEDLDLEALGKAPVLEWRGEGVASIKKGFQAAVRRADLPGVTPHVLRHTAATWMAQAGRSYEEIAGFLGNTVAMVEKVYAHHHPDHLRKAADALVGVDNSLPSANGRGNQKL